MNNAVQKSTSNKNNSTKSDPKSTNDPNKSQSTTKRRKKAKKQIIEISLWVNGCKYEFGLLCTFCAKVPAVCHCPECTDFYCESCDITAHNTKKRKNHIRTQLSKYNLNTAASVVTRAVRRYGHIRIIQERCRKIFKRYFDRKTLNYYYFNPVYATVSWRKPYCLRNLELAPYMTTEYAASKCQNLYHLWIAREKSRNELMRQYRKIFDRNRGEFYYAYNGPSKLLPKANWTKPRLLGKRSFPKDITPIFTIDVAAITIQRKWRAILIRRFLKALVRATYDEVWDPVKGRFNYYNRDTANLHQEKPILLRNEAWDPNRVPDWTVDEVSLFLRRIGLKCYVDTMKSYQVDGNALILLDDEDYDNLGIFNRIHKKKITVEIGKIFSPKKQINMSEEHTARREKIRRQKMFEASAIIIQKYFRRYSAKKEVQMYREIARINVMEKRIQQKIEATSIWWSENPHLPSRKGLKAHSVSSQGTKLPPLKLFGRRRDYLSYKGWGRRGNDINLPWIPTPAALKDKGFAGDTNPTLIYSEKLHISGYDEKRLKLFLESQD